MLDAIALGPDIEDVTMPKLSLNISKEAFYDLETVVSCLENPSPGLDSERVTVEQVLSVLADDLIKTLQDPRCLHSELMLEVLSHHGYC